MDAVIKLVAEKAGINETQAKAAVETVLAQLKDKLPGPIGGQLEGLLGGDGDENGEGGGLGGLTKGLGGLLGKD